jgi:hypothetical protein
MMSSSSSDMSDFLDSFGTCWARLSLRQLSSICRTATFRIATLAALLPTFSALCAALLVKMIHELYGFIAFVRQKFS